jgi:hypothetical protein
MIRPRINPYTICPPKLATAGHLPNGWFQGDSCILWLLVIFLDSDPYLLWMLDDHQSFIKAVTIESRLALANSLSLLLL